MGKNLCLIELDDHRDVDPGAQLAGLLVHLLAQAQLNFLDLTYIDALEPDRRADPEAVDAAGEVDDKIVGIAEQVFDPKTTIAARINPSALKTNIPTIAGLIRLPMIPR